MEQQNNSKPIKDFRSGGVQASIWRNEVEKNGQTVVRHSVRIQKQFRKEDGNYEQTEYYFRDDLPKLILVAQKAFEFISLKESKDAEESIPV
jgi:hypothetical protein